MRSGGTSRQPASEDALPDRYLSLIRHSDAILNGSGLDAMLAESALTAPADWRLNERLKTVCVALVLCFNFGTDPPGAVKPAKCAREECWIDPQSMPPSKALDKISEALQKQYERWHPRARYKACTDPTFTCVKKLCASLRRAAKSERVLLHYNGHGVPAPTENGELWVFNKHYTQYIPLSIYDLVEWVKFPSIFVLDCPGAGTLLEHIEGMRGDGVAEGSRIALAACGATETLPCNAAFPADLFTACLTTPVKVALRWFLDRHSQRSAVDPAVYEMLERVPGKHNDRRTPLGELNWIFTAVTDSIAWNVLPRKLFQKLFRQDLLLASMFRNFLLAQRVMESVGCHSQSLPRLPFMGRHTLWQSWDLAAERCLVSLPKMLCPNPMPFVRSTFFTEQLTAFRVWLQSARWTAPGAHATALVSRRSPEQLPVVLQVLLSQAHRLWALELLARFLDLGAWAVELALVVGNHPYVLKLLQSPAAELRPLLVLIWAKILRFDATTKDELLNERGHLYFICCFEDSATDARAAWKAEQAAAADQKAVDFARRAAGEQSSPSSDVRAAAHAAAHARAAEPARVPHADSLGLGATENRMLSIFVLAMVLNGCEKAQKLCLRDNLLSILLTALQSEREAEVRLWICICTGKLCEGCIPARAEAHRLNAPALLSPLLLDHTPTVRAAAAFALGQLIGAGYDSAAAAEKELRRTSSSVARGGRGAQREGERRRASAAAASAAAAASDGAAPTPTYGHQQRDLAIALRLMKCMTDCSILVRREALHAFGFLVAHPKHLASFETTVIERRAAAEAAKAEKISARPLSTTSYSSPMRRGALGLSSERTRGQGAQVGGNAGVQPSEGAAASSRYWHLWQMLLEVKRRDPASAVSLVASNLVRIVHIRIVAAEEKRLSARSSKPISPTLGGVAVGGGVPVLPGAGGGSASAGGPWQLGAEFSLPRQGGSSVSASAFGGTRGGLGGQLGGSLSSLSGSPLGGALGGGPLSGSLKSIPQLPQSGSFEQLSKSPSLHEMHNVDPASMSPPQGAREVLRAQGLYSTLFEWLSARMGRSILQSADAQAADPVSALGAAIRWRREQNGAISASAETLNRVRRCKFSACGILDNRSKITLQLIFHPYDLRLLIGIDDHERICAWDVKVRVRMFRLFLSVRLFVLFLTVPISRLFFACIVVGREGGCLEVRVAQHEPSRCVTHGLRRLAVALSFGAASAQQHGHVASLSHSRPHSRSRLLSFSFSFSVSPGTRISAVDWINPQQNSLLLTGSTDGMVRVWRNPVPGFAASDDEFGERFACAAWAAVPNLVDGGPGLVIDWQQRSGVLLAGGNSAQLRMWDLQSEQCLCRAAIGSAPFITSMATIIDAAHGGHGEKLTICGCGDGTLRLFDPRACSPHVSPISSPVLRTPPLLLLRRCSPCASVYIRAQSCWTTLAHSPIAHTLALPLQLERLLLLDPFVSWVRAQQTWAAVWEEHDKWVVNVHMQAGMQHELVSGSIDGDVRFWCVAVASRPSPPLPRTLQCVSPPHTHTRPTPFAFCATRTLSSIFACSLALSQTGI